MPITWIHGVETIESTSATTSVTEVKTAVIAIVGTAPKGPVNKVTIVNNAKDAAQFGTFAEYGLTSGFTIPYTINAIQAYGTGTIVVVNVFTPSETSETEKTVADETLNFAEGSATLAHPEKVSNLVLTSADGATTYELNTDYTFDAETGAVAKVAEGTLAEVDSVKATYKYVETIKTDNNVKDITAADIIGSTSEQGERTGLQALKDVFNQYGYNPKIIVCPEFSHEAGVREAMISIANKVRAICLVDAPKDATVDDCLKARGSEGSFNWQTTSDRVYLLYPYLKYYDQETNQDQSIPYSSVMAGLMAWNDKQNGYWYSPSNKNFVGVTGTQVKITSSYTDPDTEVQQLNAKGITSVMNAYGTGYKSFGNRLANFPETNGLPTFISSRRISDMIAESLENAQAPYVDLPLDGPIVDEIIRLGSNFLETLRSRKAIVGGSCWVSADNTTESLSDGKLIIDYEFTPPAALERITNQITLTSRYYG